MWRAKFHTDCNVEFFTTPGHVKNVEVIFPIAGHSFLPSGHVFGGIENELQYKNTVIDIEEYTVAFGTTISLDGKMNEFKVAATSILRIRASFLVSKRSGIR